MEHELGPEIEIHGERPEWLDHNEGVAIRWSSGAVWNHLDTPAKCVSGWEHSITAIRLRADHPIYEVRLPERRTSTLTRPSDELVERMIAFIEDCADNCDEGAVAILAALNPDPMIQRARDICKDEFGVILPDDAPGMRAVLRGLREGGE